MKKPLHSAGFTLVEMIVSLALFAVVSTVAVGSLIVIIDNNRELRGEQSSITNLSFAMDMMTRDIRTGYNYNCLTMSPGVYSQWSTTPSSYVIPDDNPDCLAGRTDPDDRHVITFLDAESRITGDVKRITYYHDPVENTVRRRIGDAPSQSIMSSAITVTAFDIIVTGAEDSDTEQPTATVIMEIESEDGTAFQVQTSVTQRFLDI